MNTVQEIIKARRNIRKFTPKIVSWEKVAEVLDAARYAPSSGNLQNWKFIVVQDEGKKQALAAASHDQYDITAAGVLIVVCGESVKAERYYGTRGARLFTIQNCAAAIQNMLLTAQEMGLGTAWIGAFDEEAVREAVSIPEEVRPQAIIALGHPAEQPEVPPKYPLHSLVYFNKWGGPAKDMERYLNLTAAVLKRRVDTVKKVIHNKPASFAEKAKNFLKKKR